MWCERTASFWRIIYSFIGVWVHCEIFIIKRKDMKLKLTSKQMLMLLDKVGVPKGKIISTTGAVLNRIYQSEELNLLK